MSACMSVSVCLYVCLSVCVSRWLYWSDWGHVAIISRAGMDGSHRDVVVRGGLMWPNSLSVDYQRHRLYWTDAGLQHIESSRLDGTDRKILLSEGVPHPFGIAVHDDLIYWTDWVTHNIESANKLNGSDRQVVLAGLEDLMDIRVFNRRWPTGAYDLILAVF